MRSIALAAILAVAPASVALADNDVGCGFGTQLMAGKSGVAFKVLASTTNGTFGNQTFGISFGTLGCSSEGTVTAQERVQLFAGANFDRLAVDMAQGEGEALETFANLLGVPTDARPELFEMARANYVALYPSDEVTAGEMLTALYDLMQQDQALAPYALS